MHVPLDDKIFYFKSCYNFKVMNINFYKIINFKWDRVKIHNHCVD